MSKIDDLEFDLEILRDVVYQIEEDIKALTSELGRVKELLRNALEATQEIRPARKQRHH